MQEVPKMQVQSLYQEGPLEWQPTPVFLPENLMNRAAGYGPQGHKESATAVVTKHTVHTHVARKQ